MIITAIWQNPIKLEEGDKYYYRIPPEIPKEAGCYMFFNHHGDKITILYIGQAKDLEQRLKWHFKNNVALMKGILESKNGQKKLIWCTLNTKQGQKQKKALDMIEMYLITYAKLKGHRLINVAGTKTRHDKISFRGNKTYKKIFPREITIPKY